MIDVLNDFTAKEAHPQKATIGYEFPYCSARVVMLGKASRIISSLHSAYLLLRAGKPTEAAALTRLVSDYCEDITFLAAECLAREPSESYWQFLESYFTPDPVSAADLKTLQDRRTTLKTVGRPYGYVSRRTIRAALHTLAAGTPGLNMNDFTTRARLLDHGKNGYVHAGYLQCMESYSPRSGTFDVLRITDRQVVRSAMEFICGNLLQGLLAFGYMAIERGENAWVTSIQRQAKRLETAPEYNGLP
jgi:hypothetical protein